MLCKAIYRRLTFIPMVFIQLPSFLETISTQHGRSELQRGFTTFYSHRWDVSSIIYIVFEVCCNCIPDMDFFSDLSISLELIIWKIFKQILKLLKLTQTIALYLFICVYWFEIIWPGTKCHNCWAVARKNLWLRQCPWKTYDWGNLSMVEFSS